MIKVLFVCMGNICRSPTAQGVFETFVARAGLTEFITADSAGTIASHVGNPPDQRSVAAAALRGFDLSAYRARKVDREDFTHFDLVLAMDHANHATLERLAPDEAQPRLRMFLDFAPLLDTREVPDPYYGGTDGFERVLDIVEAGADGLVRHIRETLPAVPPRQKV